MMQLADRNCRMMRAQRAVFGASAVHAPRAVLARMPCATAPGTLALHAGETTLELPFSVEHARAVDAATSALLQTYAAKSTATRPQRWECMELTLHDIPGGGLNCMELVSNPNAHATAFEAKVLLTLSGPGGLRLTTETRLSSLRADVDAYLMAAAPSATGAQR